MPLPAMTDTDETQTIHVVDDDPSIRVALDGLFRSVGYTSRTFASASEFMASGCARAAGCVILDVRLPGVSGLDFQVQLAKSGVQMPVILMTGHGDIPMSVRGMKAGAVDFLPKPFREQDMLDAVTTALARDARQRAERQGSQELRERYALLSPREREVMGFVAQGRMNKQIAWDLELSEITVKIHRGNAMRKMGARNLADFVKMAEAVKDIV